MKELKKKAKHILKLNYLKAVLICLIMLFLVGSYETTPKVFKTDIKIFEMCTETINKYGNITNAINYINSENEEQVNNGEEIKKFEKDAKVTGGVFKVVFDYAAIAENTVYSFISKIIATAMSSKLAASALTITLLIAILYRIFVAYGLMVGEKRFFLKSYNNPNTTEKELLSVFKAGYISTIKAIFLSRIYVFLWGFTVIGAIIKHYSYILVPYILAENPNIKANEAIILSRKLMKGKKFQIFKLDVSFIGWQILNYLTFGILGVLFINPYYNYIMTGYYLKIRKNISDENKKYFPNEEIFIEQEKIIDIEKQEKYYHQYSLTSLILFFFTFAFVGWAWEVLLYLIKDGIFVNRGVLLGPWLPIYGTGCTVFLILLLPKKSKKLFDNRLLTFVTIMAICAVIEYGTAWYLETFKHLKWWDYTGSFMNLHGRICLEGTVFFGIGGSFCIYVVAPFLNNLYEKINKKLKIILCVFLVVIFTIDVIHSKDHPNVGKGITDYKSKVSITRNISEA